MGQRNDQSLGGGKMRIKSVGKILCMASVVAVMAQAAAAEKVLKLGTVGFLTPQKQDFNPSIKWEEISQFNLGLDLDMFDRTLGLIIDYYLKKTEDMLLLFPNPAFSSLPNPIRNAASVKNNGLEIALTYRNHIRDFNFNISTNVGFNKNEITNLNGGLPLTGASTRIFDGTPDLT
jgi:hypothetical protein